MASPPQQCLHGSAIHVIEALPQVEGDLAGEPVRVLGMDAQGYRVPRGGWFGIGIKPNS